MTSKTVLLALFSFIIFSCSSDDDSSSETDPDLSEVFIVTIDKDTSNEIIVNIDDPHAELPCRIEYFTAPDIVSNGTALTNLSFYIPGILVIETGSVGVGETVLDPETGPEEWGFTITIDGIEYDALSGSVSFTKYDTTAWDINGEPILISGVLDVVIIETNGTGTRTLLIEFDNVQSPFAGAC